MLLKVSFFDGGDELAVLVLVLGADLGQCKNGSSLNSISAGTCNMSRGLTHLVVNNGTEPGLALDYSIWDAHPDICQTKS